MHREWLWFTDHEIYSRYAKEFDNMSVSERDKELNSSTGLCLVEYSILVWVSLIFFVLF